jgi:hypothetical protein
MIDWASDGVVHYPGGPTSTTRAGRHSAASVDPTDGDNALQRWEDFTHPTDELVLMLEGKMEFEIAGKVGHPAIGE